MVVEMLLELDEDSYEEVVVLFDFCEDTRELGTLLRYIDSQTGAGCIIHPTCPTDFNFTGHVHVVSRVVGNRQKVWLDTTPVRSGMLETSRKLLRKRQTGTSKRRSRITMGILIHRMATTVSWEAQRRCLSTMNEHDCRSRNVESILRNKWCLDKVSELLDVFLEKL